MPSYALIELPDEFTPLDEGREIVRGRPEHCLIAAAECCDPLALYDVRVNKLGEIQRGLRSRELAEARHREAAMAQHPHAG